MASVITATIVAGSSNKPPLGTTGLISGTLTVGAGNYAAGGIAFKAVLEAALAALAFGTPGFVDRAFTIQHIIINGIAGYHYEYSKASGKVLFRYADYDAGADGPLIEIPNGATPGGITGDTISFLAVVTYPAA